MLVPARENDVEPQVLHQRSRPQQSQNGDGRLYRVFGQLGVPCGVFRDRLMLVVFRYEGRRVDVFPFAFVI